VNEINVRDIEGSVAGLRAEPRAPRIPERAQPSETQLARRGTIFAADVPQGEDAWGLEAVLRPLAELAAHRDTEAPLTIGILGAPGSGKSFALGVLLAQIETLARKSGDRDRFLKSIATLRIDATRLDGDPALVLAGSIYDSLGAAFPDLVGGAAEAIRDPRSVARETAERLDDARRRLDSERQKLSEIESRRARVFETILFDTAGSKVDAYARANRARIEGRLESFGFSGDPILNFKSMVRDLAESGGPLSRAGAALRSFWAFKGQVRLLVTSAMLFLVGLGLAAALTNQAVWLGWLRNLNESLGPVVDWLRAHVDWLSTLKQIAYAGAVLALVLNAFRALRFVQPLYRGVTLLESDIGEKRRDIDALYAHQMRRVDALTADVERMAQLAAEADRRADSHGGKPNSHLEPSPFDDGSLRLRVERFFVSLGRLLQRQGSSTATSDAGKAAPERVVIAIDNMDALAPAAAAAALEATHRALAQPGVVLLLALDPARLSNLGSDMVQRLEKWIQVPFRVGPDVATLDAGGLVAQIIGRGERKREVAADRLTDWTISDAEAVALAALAPIAGASPRMVKRFVNLYRVVRTQAPEFKTELALMLALDLGGTGGERAAIAAALAEASGADVDATEFGPRIPGALYEAGVTDVSKAALRRAAAIVRCYSLRG
jgi:hypothetical protein